jgi:hypothetical protein
MQTHYNRKNVTQKKSGHGSKLDLHFLIGGKTICAASYRIVGNTRYIELPLPVSRLLSA